MTRIADPLKQEELQLGEDEELVDLLTEIDQEPQAAESTQETAQEEEVKEENIDRSKGAHEAAKHEQEQCKVEMQSLSFRIHGVKPRRKTDHTCK